MKVLVIILLIVRAILCDEHFKQVYSNTIELDLMAPNATISKEYIKENNLITSFKVWREQIYWIIPRRKYGISVTLGISSIPKRINSIIRYKPYPNLTMQEIGNCSAFQSVQSIEIDPKHRMWVLDSGSANVSSNEEVKKCTPSIFILDLNNNGEKLFRHEFSANVTTASNDFLNNMVLDHEGGGFAYITDVSDDPGLIVFSLARNTSWKIRYPEYHRESIASDDQRLDRISLIALSPASDNDRFVYYSQPSSFKLRRTSVYSLRHDNMTDNNTLHSDEMMGWHSLPLTMTMDNANFLYIGKLNDYRITKWNSQQPKTAKDKKKLPTSDSFTVVGLTIDNRERCWCLVKIKESENRYQLFKMSIYSKNYQYYKDGGIPALPRLRRRDNTALGTHENLISTDTANRTGEDEDDHDRFNSGRKGIDDSIATSTHTMSNTSPDDSLYDDRSALETIGSLKNRSYPEGVGTIHDQSTDPTLLPIINDDTPTADNSTNSNVFSPVNGTNSSSDDSSSEFEPSALVLSGMVLFVCMGSLWFALYIGCKYLFNISTKYTK